MGVTRLDTRGLKCPLPALKTRRALARLPAGDVLIVEATDPLAEIDIPHLARQQGDAIERIERRPGVLCFTIRRGAND